MAGNLSWEAKVDSMLRQTGDNLERLKDQLRGQNEQSAWTQPPLRDTKQADVGVPVYAASVSLPFAEGNYRMADWHRVTQGQALRSTTAVLRDEQKESTPQYSPLLLCDLTKRLSQQEMEIASLRLALAKVEERNGEHEGDIRRLKAESSELRSRMEDQEVHVTTESKFEQWKAQMTAEVHSLCSTVSAHHGIQQGRSEDRKGVAQLTHELQKTKISTSGDIHWLNQELRAVKTQLGQLEVQVASLQCSIGQLQNDAKECKSHRTKHQHDYPQHINHIRRDLDSLECRAVRCERELSLRDRPWHSVEQVAGRGSGSGDDGGRRGQEGCVGERLSFTSEISSREGESTAEDVSALSLSSLREDSPTGLSLSDHGTPTPQLNSSSDF